MPKTRTTPTKTKAMKQSQSLELDRLKRAEQELSRIVDHATETLCRLIDNDQQTLEYYTVRAASIAYSAATCPQVKDGTWTVEQAERYNLAETIKVTVEAVTERDELGQFSALLCQCFVSIGLSLVNWDDVADHYLQKYRESRAR